MPNWVTNKVTVSGGLNDVERLYRKLCSPHPLADKTKGEGELTFYNVISPTDIEEYVDGWYEWNIENWGVKWDASEGESGIDRDGDLYLNFDTPWGIPDKVLDWLVDYCVDNSLVLNWWFEEEQGWGGEVKLNYLPDGEPSISTETWDIPRSHADYVKRGKWERGRWECVCFEDWEIDPEDWFDDCPKKADQIEANKIVLELYEASKE
jgi:hypothetical protein